MRHSAGRGETSSVTFNSDLVSEEADRIRQEQTQVKAPPRSRHCHVRSAFGRVQKVELEEGSSRLFTLLIWIALCNTILLCT